jgi:FkbM family methyltransferase
VGDAVARILRTAPPFRGKARLGRLIGTPRASLAQVRMRDGSLMKIDLRSPTERDAYWTGEYEGGVVRRLARMLPVDSVVLDVGANIGFFTVGLAHGAGARVYAFEPMPANLERLRENVAANDLGERVVVTRVALGVGPGEVWLAPEPGEADTGNAAQADPGADGAVRVEVRSLDAVAEELAIDRCDLVKIDVEGAELEVLRGGESFFRRFRPAIYAELNRYWMSHFGWTEQDLLALVAPWGYEAGRIRGTGRVDDVLLVPSP